jgi:hypothetical protein
MEECSIELSRSIHVEIIAAHHLLSLAPKEGGSLRRASCGHSRDAPSSAMMTPCPPVNPDSPSLHLKQGSGHSTVLTS